MALEDNFYLLSFDNDKTIQYINSKDPSSSNEQDDEGFEEAFNFTEEFPDIITSGLWVSNDCFVYTNSKGHIYYLIE